MIHLIVINAIKGHGYVEYIPRTLNSEDYEYCLQQLQMRYHLGASLPCWDRDAVHLVGHMLR